MRHHPIILSTIFVLLVLIVSAGVLHGCGDRATLPVAEC
jgi:hypothetical protein